VQLAWFVRAVSVPFTGIIFSMRSVMGSNASNLSPFDIAGLCTVSVGLIVYNWDTYAARKQQYRKLPHAADDAATVRQDA
jgi:hypothetical protein